MNLALHPESHSDLMLLQPYDIDYSHRAGVNYMLLQPYAVDNTDLEPKLPRCYYSPMTLTL